MKAYTIDLRERIVEFVKDVGAKTEAALRFKVSRKTVYRYLEAAAAGRLTPKRSWGRWRKIDPARVRRAYFGEVLLGQPPNICVFVLKIGFSVHFSEMSGTCFS